MDESLSHGYYGIGIVHGKTPANLGVLWRSAQNMGASFIFTIGRRYKKQSSDTHKATAAIPYYHYEDFTQFQQNLPKGAMLIGVELTKDAQPLEEFAHPRNAVYLLGAEDHGLPSEILSRCHKVIKLDTPKSLNVSIAGSIVMYNRKTRGFTHYVDGKPAG